MMAAFKRSSMNSACINLDADESTLFLISQSANCAFVATFAAFSPCVGRRLFYYLWGFVHIRPLLYIDASKNDETKVTLTANKQTSRETAASKRSRVCNYQWRWLMRFSGSEGLLPGFQRTTEIWKLGTSIRDVSRETASCCVFAHWLQRSLICSDVKLYLLSDPGNATVTVTVLTPQCVAQTPGVCFCYKNIA